MDSTWSKGIWTLPQRIFPKTTLIFALMSVKDQHKFKFPNIWDENEFAASKILQIQVISLYTAWQDAWKCNVCRKV